MNSSYVLSFIRRNVKTQDKQLKEAAYRTYVRPRSNIVQSYVTNGHNGSHVEWKWFKCQPQGMFKMTARGSRGGRYRCPSNGRGPMILL